MTAAKVETTIRWIVAMVLGGIGGAAGFKHTHDWAEQNGQHGWLAWSVAVVVEGIAIVAGFEIRRDHRRGHHKRITFPMTVLVIGFGIQMAAQVANARPTVAGWLLAAMPALGFLTVVKLLMRNPVTPAAVAASSESVADVSADDELAPPVAAMVPLTRLRLPAGMHQVLTDTARRATAEGRSLTADDIRTAVRVSPALAEQWAAALTAEAPAVNGHTVRP